MGHFALARSPALIGMIQGMQTQGIDILESGRQQGIIQSGVSIIQQGTELILAPLTE
jgi:hypothetical protein